ncbi:hypothetical protein CEXT_797251 [Caerostris extrusa]|uniref:Uncharacterized protein n=1 Tax=Caerostris extrusa TaxID=172846 RepID=A0AAV4RDA0_CAEEX|nr:hypothetical protein CEXT_797251 [Caerostris extrusa]
MYNSGSPQDGLQGYTGAYAALSGSRYISLGPSGTLDSVFRPTTTPFYQPYVPWMTRPYTLEDFRERSRRTAGKAPPQPDGFLPAAAGSPGADLRQDPVPGPGEQGEPRKTGLPEPKIQNRRAKQRKLQKGGDKTFSIQDKPMQGRHKLHHHLAPASSLVEKDAAIKPTSAQSRLEGEPNQTFQCKTRGMYLIPASRLPSEDLLAKNSIPNPSELNYEPTVAEHANFKTKSVNGNSNYSGSPKAQNNDYEDLSSEIQQSSDPIRQHPLSFWAGKLPTYINPTTADTQCRFLPMVSSFPVSTYTQGTGPLYLLC